LKSSARNVNLPPLDDLFSTEESRAGAIREQIVDIPLTELYGEARTRSLFQYERMEDDEHWNRVGAISPRLAELMLGNGADEPSAQAFSKELANETTRLKGGSRR
jgi:hypothetical protein